jgi:beta-lactamase class A
MMHRDRGQEGAHVSLAGSIEQVVSGRPGTFGVYARNLGTDETVAINADRIFPAESAAKTFILVYYSELVASGAVDPTDRVRLDDESRYIGTGVLRFLADGLEPTLADLAWLMVIVSDNTATAMLMQAIGGPADVNARMRELGYPTANLNESITFEGAMAGELFSTSSPHDLAEVYTHLDDEARAMLYRQQHLIGLPRRLPHVAHAVDVGITMPVRVYNKTGNGAGNFIDSGRFETDAAAWIVAAMATEQTDFAMRPDDAAPAAFGEIGELLFTAWGQTDP